MTPEHEEAYQLAVKHGVKRKAGMVPVPELAALIADVRMQRTDQITEIVLQLAVEYSNAVPASGYADLLVDLNGLIRARLEEK